MVSATQKERKDLILEYLLCAMHTTRKEKKLSPSLSHSPKERVQEITAHISFTFTFDASSQAAAKAAPMQTRTGRLSGGLNPPALNTVEARFPPLSAASTRDQAAFGRILGHDHVFAVISKLKYKLASMSRRKHSISVSRRYDSRLLVKLEAESILENPS